MNIIWSCKLKNKKKFWKKTEKIKKPYGDYLDDDGSGNGLEPTSGYDEELDPSPNRRSAGDRRWPICCCEYRSGYDVDEDGEEEEEEAMKGAGEEE